jgi:transcriptional regulator with XRE-family HTH domain
MYNYHEVSALDIGIKIKEFRKSKGLTQQELAEKIGVTAVTVTRYENNSRKPDFVILNEIADALDCKLADLVNAENSNEPVKENPQLYHFEQFLSALGYKIMFDAEDAYLFIKTKEGTYELEMKGLEDIYTSSRSFIEYQLHELIKGSRKMKK